MGSGGQTPGALFICGADLGLNCHDWRRNDKEWSVSLVVHLSFTPWL